MKRIRIANVEYDVASPFRLLGSSAWCRSLSNSRVSLALSYQEHLPTENAMLLAKGLVDIALIPAADFASNGGYVGLDFGVANRLPNSELVLYANEPLENVRTIYIYEGASTSVHLLRLVIKTRSVRLVRLDDQEPCPELGPGEAVLVLHSKTTPARTEYQIQEDLVARWFQRTGLPMPFLVWATKPGVLAATELRAINELFHKAVVASKKDGIHCFYLDEELLSALRIFLDDCAALKALPEISYRTAKAPLGSDYIQPHLPSWRGLFRRALDGERMSVRDAALLAERATIAELTLAAEMARARKGTALRLLPQITVAIGCPRKNLEMIGQWCTRNQVGRVRIENDPGEGDFLDSLEEIAEVLGNDFGCEIEINDPHSIVVAALRRNLSLKTLVTRLIAAGIRILRARNEIVSSFGEVIQLFHRFGGQSGISAQLKLRENWDDRFRRLQSIRSLQDENPGISYIEIHRPFPSAVEIETALRFGLSLRLFLDNISGLRIPWIAGADLGSLLMLSSAASEISLTVAPTEVGEREISQTQKMFEQLGIEVERKMLPSRVAQIWH